MKLLFDENLSYRLIKKLKNVLPESIHVNDAGLSSADDQSIWEYAKKNNFLIISKDIDFHQLSFLYGHPPKIIWLRCGNVSTDDIEKIILQNITKIKDFFLDPLASFLAL